MDHRQEEQVEKVKVVDRRRFVMDESGKVHERPDAPQTEKPKTVSQPAPQPAKTATGEASGNSQAAAEHKQASASKPDPDKKANPQNEALSAKFIEFLNSLAHSMLVHLGEIPDPGSGLVREHLEAAKQTLEMLGVLRQKTDANLTAQERQIFDTLLYELMVRFRTKTESINMKMNKGGKTV